MLESCLLCFEGIYLLSLDCIALIADEISVIFSSAMLPSSPFCAVLYRVPCEYQRTNIAFHVNSGSSAYWLGLLVEYVNGDGDLGAVDLKQVGS